MDSTKRHSSAAVNFLQEVTGEPWRLGLFELLRWLEAAENDRPRLADSTSSQSDIGRLGQRPNMAFQGADIAEFNLSEDGEHADIDCNQFGFWGPNGILPLHLTESAYRQTALSNTALKAFADIFHHRMIALFYRMYADSEPTIEMDRPTSNRFDYFLGALSGSLTLDEKNTQDTRAHQWQRYYHAGVLSQRARSASGLAMLLSSVLDMPVAIDDASARWLDLDASDQSALGEGSLALGQSAYLGESCLTLHGEFTVQIGPIPAEQLGDFLPGSRHYQTCQRWLRSFCGFSYQWRLQIDIFSGPSDGVSLDGDRALGWQSWLGHRDERTVHVIVPNQH